MIAYKLVENISDPCNAKENYQSTTRNPPPPPPPPAKSVKQSEIIAYQPKPFENPNIVDIKSGIIENPEILHNFFKTKRQGKNVSQVDCNSSLYSDTKKVKIFQKKHKNNNTTTGF